MFSLFSMVCWPDWLKFTHVKWIDWDDSSNHLPNNFFSKCLPISNVRWQPSILCNKPSGEIRLGSHCQHTKNLQVSHRTDSKASSRIVLLIYTCTYSVNIYIWNVCHSHGTIPSFLPSSCPFSMQAWSLPPTCLWTWCLKVQSSKVLQDFLMVLQALTHTI